MKCLQMIEEAAAFGSLRNEEPSGFLAEHSALPRLSALPSPSALSGGDNPKQNAPIFL